MNEALIVFGVGAAVAFIAILHIEGALRPSYDPVYHTGSELELGDRGWIQRANFLLMGMGMFAYAFGVYRTLDLVVEPVLLAIFGFGMIVAGVFVPDPSRGYPPEAEPAARADSSWHHQVHHVVSGPVAFLALLGACILLAAQLEGGWRVYTVVTAVLGLALTIATAVAFQRDARNTGLIQRGLLVVYWTWLVLLGIHLVTSSPGA